MRTAASVPNFVVCRILHRYITVITKFYDCISDKSW